MASRRCCSTCLPATGPRARSEERRGVELAIAYAQVLGNTQINCLAGIRPQGFDEAFLEETLVENLRYAADKLQAAGIRLVMEAINTRDIPGFYLNTTAQALSIREQVGSANLFLQYDIYHMQIMEGDLEHLDRIGYPGWIGCEYKPLTTTEAGLSWLKSHNAI